jgi:hypothetical protein
MPGGLLRCYGSRRVATKHVPRPDWQGGIANSNMNNKELFKNIEGLVDQLATTASYSQDKEQLQFLREALNQRLWERIPLTLTDKVAEKCADKILAKVRKDRKERLKAAAKCQNPPEPPRELSIDREVHRNNRVLA